MAKFYSIVTAHDRLPCSESEYTALADALERAAQTNDEPHGFSLEWDAADGLYLFAEEDGRLEHLPEWVLAMLGELIARAGRDHLECGVAFTASRRVAGSHSGTAFRILRDGSILTRTEIWAP